jgi:hypothetical protein
MDESEYFRVGDTRNGEFLGDDMERGDLWYNICVWCDLEDLDEIVKRTV